MVKVALLGGVRRLLDIAGQVGIPVVVSSALDSAVGISRGLLAAAALPTLTHACGLGTGGLFVDDVAESLVAGRRGAAGLVPSDPAPRPVDGAGRATSPPAMVDQPRRGLLPVIALNITSYSNGAANPA